MRAEQVTQSITYHGEGAVWSDSWGGLRFVDMLAGDILTLADTGSVTREHVGTVAAVVRPRTHGGAVIGLERGFGLEAPDGGVEPLAELWTETDIRMNEGGCDPDGRFYCGSMAYDKRQGAGRLYRLDPDLSTRVVLHDVTISNGLDWSPDGTLAYYNDTPTGRIAVFDYDRDAGLTGRRSFVEIAEGHGHPDGLTVDAEGGVWTALYGSGTVHRYSPEGTLDEVVEVGPNQVTSCTFGGANLDELYITTSREGLGPDEQPQAGALFRALVGVTGMPVRTFAG